MPVLPASRTLTRPPGEAVAPAVFHAVCSVAATRTGGWDRHRHAGHEVIVATAGDYRCALNGEPVALAPGEALVVKPGDWHEDLLRPGTTYHAVWFRFTGELIRPTATAAEQVSRPGAALAAAVGQLVRLATAGATAARLDAALAALLGVLVDGLPETGLGSAFAADPGFAARLHAVFARLPAGCAPIEVLARAAGLSRRTLERRCRETFACGPAQAHARWRLRRAGELLRTTDWPVRAVSETLGFANPFHFSRAFARVHGAPPAAWRRGGNG